MEGQRSSSVVIESTRRLTALINPDVFFVRTSSGSVGFLGSSAMGRHGTSGILRVRAWCSAWVLGRIGITATVPAAAVGADPLLADGTGPTPAYVTPTFW